VGLATSFLNGSKEEWSLVRRHPSEKVFGIQLAGSKPQTIIPAAEAIARECGDNIDFIDINCGCPIDLVFNSGSGSARTPLLSRLISSLDLATVLDTAGKLGKMVVGLNKVLGNIPVTVKLRTGVKDGKNNAHNLMPRLSTEWKAGCITVTFFPVKSTLILIQTASWSHKTATIHQVSGLGLY
jgi:tRNA-dihydrouridine synthase 3